MIAELDKKLRDLFPDLITKKTPIECANGWFDLIKELCSKIAPLAKDQERFGEPMHAVQIKEKYGTLRFYMNFETDEISDLIWEYEHKSAQICEICGKPGSIHKSNNWINTFCDDHKRNRKQA